VEEDRRMNLWHGLHHGSNAKEIKESIPEASPSLTTFTLTRQPFSEVGSLDRIGSTLIAVRIRSKSYNLATNCRLNHHGNTEAVGDAILRHGSPDRWSHRAEGILSLECTQQWASSPFALVAAFTPLAGPRPITLTNGLLHKQRPTHEVQFPAPTLPFPALLVRRCLPLVAVDVDVPAARSPNSCGAFGTRAVDPFGPPGGKLLLRR
jgi:hypothetical protein